MSATKALERQKIAQQSFTARGEEIGQPSDRSGKSCCLRHCSVVCCRIKSADTQFLTKTVKNALLLITLYFTLRTDKRSISQGAFFGPMLDVPLPSKLFCGFQRQDYFFDRNFMTKIVRFYIGFKSGGLFFPINLGKIPDISFYF